MAERRVTHTDKDNDGDIESLANPGEPWSPRASADAIRDIEQGLHQYFVHEESYRTDVHVVTSTEDGFKYLRTDADEASKNNLDNLPYP